MRSIKLTQNSLGKILEKVVIDLRIERKIEPEDEAEVHRKKNSKFV
jgi:hypothetical protein